MAAGSVPAAFLLLGGGGRFHATVQVSRARVAGMRSLHRFLILDVLVVTLAGSAGAADWLAWRGPRGDGSTSEKSFPVRWSRTENVRWRVELPDRGNSSPIVVGGRVILTQAIERENRRFLVAYDRKDGKRLWELGTTFDAKEATHEDNPYAAASPVSDGRRVVAYLGSAGVLACDLAGRELWRRDLGLQNHEWGYSSSPVILGSRVFVYHGPGPSSRLVALELEDGRVAWEKPLPEPVPTERTDGFKGRSPGIVGSFATPLVVTSPGPEAVVLGLPGSLVALGVADGRELWRSSGLNPLVYASPFQADDQVIAMGGFFGSSLAVRLDGSGDVTESRRVWREERSRKNRLGSAVRKDDTLYLVNMDGFFECVDLATGRQLWEERLNGPGANDASWSSVTLAGDRIYAVNRSGDTFVLKASRQFEVLAVNSVGESTNSSLAMSDGEILLRTWKGLWCFRESTSAGR